MFLLIKYVFITSHLNELFYKLGGESFLKFDGFWGDWSSQMVCPPASNNYIVGFITRVEPGLQLKH